MDDGHIFTIMRVGTTQKAGQVKLLPSFEGRFNPAIYLAWELEVEQVFSHHDFSELERV